MGAQASTAGGAVSPEDISFAEDSIKELQESPWHNSGIVLPWEDSGTVNMPNLGRLIDAVKDLPARDVLRRLSRVLRLPNADEQVQVRFVC